MRALAVAAAILFLGAAPASRLRAAEELVDGIAAQVGSEIVLVSEVLAMVAPAEARMREAGLSDVEIAKLRADGLESMIEWRLIEKVVRQTELYASDTEIDEAIATIARENGLSAAQLRRSVEGQGMPFEEYRAQIKREIERRKVVGAMVTSKVRIEEADIQKLYEERFSDQPEGGEQYHIRQLLVPIGDGSGRTLEEVCTQVQGALARIEAGEAFEKIASEMSAVEPMKGGDIGWLHSGSLAPWMSTAVGGMSAGSVSDVIELPFGCCLLKVVERRKFEAMTFETVRPSLEQEVFEQKLQEDLRAWLEKLRERTYIERRGYFADAASFKHASGAPAVPEQEGSARP